MGLDSFVKFKVLILVWFWLSISMDGIDYCSMVMGNDYERSCYGRSCYERSCYGQWLKVMVMRFESVKYLDVSGFGSLRIWFGDGNTPLMFASSKIRCPAYTVFY